MRLEELGLIGNCQFSALVANTGEVVWCCLPRFDSEPVFARLLDAREGGGFLAGPAEGGRGAQRHVDNTNILEARFEAEGGAFRVVDFAPRFLQHDRTFRPTMLVRVIEPISGNPRIVVNCSPILGWSKRLRQRLHGSNQVRYKGYANPLRVTTDVPLAYLNGAPFALNGGRHLVLSYGPPVEEALSPMCERFLSETERYWGRWVIALSEELDRDV